MLNKLDLDLQIRSKATHQKWRPVEPIEKTPIEKEEEGKSTSRSRSSLLLERASLNSNFI